MKKLLLTSAAIVGLAAGASAQGLVLFDNTVANYGYSQNTEGNYYVGSLTVQIWSLAGSTVDAGISAGNGQAGGNTVGYGLLTHDGFVLDATETVSLTAAAQGGIAGGPVTLPNVTAPNGVIAIAAWTGGSYGAFGTYSGTIAFHEGDIVPIGAPQSPPNDISAGWNAFNSDLIMTQVVPEPGTLAMAGLGAAALLIFRRRK